MKFLKHAFCDRLFIVIVLLPFFVSSVYIGVLAKNRYASFTQVVVRQSGENRAPQSSGVAMLLSGINPTSREETLYLKEFVNSLDMLRVLERDLNWRGHYNKQFSDPLYWLPDDAPVEDIVKFFRRVVRPHFDEITGLLSIEVQSYDPSFSAEVTAIIVRESERLVNDISQQMARSQLEFADSELKTARERLTVSQEQLLRFQSKNNVLDAQATANSRNEIIAQLEGELVRERAALTNLLSTFNTDSTQVKQKNSRIAALEKQLKRESDRLLSPPDGDQLNVVVAQYRDLTLASEFAVESYKLALMAVERTRVDSVKNIRSLVTIVRPSVAESPIYPTRLYNLLTVLLALLLVFGIVRFIVASIQDHRD